MTDFYFQLIIAVFFLAIVTLMFFLWRVKRRTDLFFQKGSEDFEKMVKEQLKEIKAQQGELEKIQKEIARLKEISRISFQKSGLVRFNPFKDVGGDQSFSLSLLDSENNGFVITSLYSREGNRVYAKPVNDGKSEYSLSEEEKKAIERAKGSQIQNPKSEIRNNIK